MADTKQEKLAEFETGMLPLIKNAFLNPRTGVKALFYGFPVIYGPFAYYMESVDTQNALYWSASIFVVSFASIGVGTFLDQIINGFDITSTLKRWVAEEKEAAKIEPVKTFEGVTRVMVNGVEKAIINVPLWKAAGGVTIKDFKTGYLPVTAINGSDSWEERQGEYDPELNVIHGIVDDVFADEFPQATKPQVIETMLAQAHPIAWLIDNVQSNKVALKLDVVLSPGSLADVKKDPHTYENYVTNFLDLAIQNYIKNTPIDVEKVRAVELFKIYY